MQNGFILYGIVSLEPCPKTSFNIVHRAQNFWQTWTHTQKKSSFLLLLVYSPLLLFNAEKIGKDMPVPHYIRFKWLCCTQCHSYSYLVDIVECFLIVCFHLDCRFKMSIRVQAIAAFQRNDITLDQSTNKTEIWMKT